MKGRIAKFTILAVACLLGLGQMFVSSIAIGSIPESEPQRRSQTKRQTQSPAKNTPQRRNYSQFSHSIAQHQLACNACHKFPTANWNKVRTGDSAFPDVTDFPEHSSCVKCHRQQFFTGAQPVICTICHTNPSPRDSSRHPFPNPVERFNASKHSQNFVSEFGIGFPHDKHVDIVGIIHSGDYRAQSVRFLPAMFEQDKSEKKNEPKAEESEPKSCAFCHKTYQAQGESDEEYVTKPPKNLPDEAFWLKKGAFKTTPTHAVCFTCHAQDGMQPSSSDCGTCHKLLPPAQRSSLTQAHGDFDPKLAAAMGINDKLTLERWSGRNTAKFRHEWIPHASLSCTSCHNVATLNTLDKRTRTQVKSCAGEGTGCHIEATTDGILNLEIDKKKANPTFQCTKCHVLNGKNPPPETHISAVSAAQKK
ncbi:MAG TPA: hypothetical protein VNO24_05840 [Blastocatellia bacterium]|nr:hypothetical protein [Blastocatellia bacterium]